MSKTSCKEALNNMAKRGVLTLH